MSKKTGLDEGIVVVGAGGHGKVVVATLQAAGHLVAEIWDDDPERWGCTVLGIPVLGPIQTRSTRAPKRPAVLGIGDNQTRRRFAELPLTWISAIHPGAIVHPSARVGDGTVVFAGAVVQPEATLGRHVLVNTGALIDHDCRLGDYVHLAPGARLAGEVRIDEGALIGMGASVLPGRVVGEWSTVGAGSVVQRDVAPGSTVVGVPARALPAPDSRS